jgi:hypothetical protein
MCFGYLGWKPQDFWRASVWEIAIAMDGLLQSKGIKKRVNQDTARIDRLKKLLDKEKERERNRDRYKRASSQDQS